MECLHGEIVIGLGYRKEISTGTRVLAWGVQLVAEKWGPLCREIIGHPMRMPLGSRRVIISRPLQFGVVRTGVCWDTGASEKRG